MDNKLTVQFLNHVKNNKTLKKDKREWLSITL